MSTAMRKGIHVASMDAVFKTDQTEHRDRIIRAKNSLKEFFAFIFVLRHMILMNIE